MTTKPIHVLLVEDNPGDVRFVSEMVRKASNLSIHQVDHLAAGIAYLAGHAADVVLLDLGLPDSQGLDTLRTILRAGHAAPVVVLTGQDDEAVGQAAVREGAQDYLIKGQVAGSLLVRGLLYAVERKRAQEALRRASSEYRALAENLPDLLARFDSGLRHLYVNQAAARAGVLSAEEYVGKTIAESGVPAQAALEWEERIRGVFSSGKPLDVESEFITPDGPRFFLTSLIPERAEDGSIQSVLSIARDLTERKKIENELRRGMDILARTQEIAHLGSWEWDVATDTVFWSDELFRIFGLAPADKAPSFAEHSKYYHPEDLRRLEDAIAATIAHGTPFEVELRMTRKDGESLVCLGRGHTIPSPKGTPYFAGSFQDITERKKLELELLKSQMKFQALVETTSEFFWEMDSHGVYTYCSPQMKSLWGLDPKVMVGKTPFDLLPPEDRDQAARGFAALLNSASAFQNMEIRSFDGAGQIRFLEISGVPFFGKDGKLEGYRGITRDVTERRRAEEQLRNERERAQQYFEIAGVLMVVLDRFGRVVQINRRACEILGCEEAQIRGKIWFEHFIPKREREAVIGVFERIIGGSLARDEYVENLVLTQGGEERIIAWHNSYVRDASGAIAGTLSSGEDITERRQLQASLAQADRLASMGMLAAGVAHEINNPLAYVLFNIESLAEDLPKVVNAAKRCCKALREQVGEGAFAKIVGEDASMLQPAMLEDAVDRAREALAGAQRIKSISRGLGTFSRVEQVELSPVDINFAIDCALRLAANEIKYRARLVRDLGQVPAVWASEGKLSQVILNLLVNSAHAIDEGHVEKNRIGVRTWAEGSEVFAEVEDTGKGIPSENLERIFDPFFTTKPMGKGSGLGLSICKNIVAGFGGDIRVESEVGKGTRFVIRLPVKSDQEPTEQPGSAGSSKPQVPAVRGRILAVDDEDGIRNALKRMLGRDHEMVLAQSGEQAQAIIEKDPAFDLILCDLMMPTMTGMELHAWLAAKNPALAARMVFFTGGAFTPKAAQYISSVPNLKIEKPFDPGNFKKLVSELILAAKGKT